MTAFVLVNPHSAGGRTGRDWKALSRMLRDSRPDFKVAFTRRRGDASWLVREALSAGHDEVIAVGGDGTINEAVNGFFDADGPTASDAVLGFITSGTGGDFRKSFNIEPNLKDGLERLTSGQVRQVDVGRVTCLGRDGVCVVRHFVNVASFGLSGLVVDAVNRARFAKLFGGSFTFAFHSLSALLFFRPRGVRLILDNGFD